MGKYGEEQIGRGRRIVSGPWAWIKRQTSKLRRRQERVDVENVPPKQTKGWAD